MDANKDGKVTAEERSAFLEKVGKSFDAADKDGDGVISEQELLDHLGKGPLMDLTPATIVLTIVVFVLLLVILSKAAWKPILDALKKREDTIAKALDDAKAANEVAQAKIQEYEAKIDHAKEEAAEITDEARKDAEDIKARIQAEAEQESEAIKDRAQREIDQMSHAAWDQVVNDAADLAVEAANKIIGEGLNPEGHAEIVSKVVSDFAAERGGSGA